MIRILFLLGLAHFAQPATAETRQLGNIIYDVPGNWDVGRLEGGIQTLTNSSPDEVCEYCYIYIATGAKKSGTLVRWLATQAPRFVDEDDRDVMTVIQPPDLVELGSVKAALTGLKVDSNVLIVMGFELSDRFEAVAFQGPAYDEADLTESMATFQDQISPMFNNLKFVSEGAKPLLPAAKPGDLSGLYWGFYTYSTLGFDMMMKIEVGQRRLVFWPDGYFYDGTPPMGLQPLDPDRLMAAGDGAFGTYRHSGNRLYLTFATGEKERLTADGDDWKDDDTTLSAVTPVPDGTRLDGDISSFFYSGFTPGSGISGGISSSSETTFLPDGTYTGSSFGGSFGSFETGGTVTGGFAGSNENATGGTYEVQDGLLIQYPHDGSQPTRSMIFTAGDDILIDEAFLDTD
jgi:hypothetical protein